MKILITNTGPWGTGSFTVAKGVMEELLALNHEVKIFFPDTKLPSPDLAYYYDNPELFEIWQFPIKNSQTHLSTFPLIIPDPHPRNTHRRTFLQLTEAEKQLYFQDFEKRIVKLIDEFQPDIIECQHIWAFDHIIEKLGHPFICVAHHSDQLGFSYDHKMQPLALKSAKKAEYIFAISEYVKKEVLTLYGVEKDKVIVIGNGYDKKVFKKQKVNKAALFKKLGLNIPQNAHLVSFAGKISRTKGIDILLQANKLIPAQENIHFLILGAGDINEVLEEATEESKKLCSFERVHFLGHQPSQILSQIHNISTISTLPSRSEGFGIACLEAMACGLPVVVTRTGHLEKYAVGEIISSESPQELARAIVKLVNLSSKKYRALSKKALAKAQEFSWSEITKKRLQYYSKVIKDNNKPKKHILRGSKNMGKNILVVEDDQDASMLVDKILKYYKHTVKIIASSKEALEYCKNNPPPDIILMDISLPEITGLELTKMIKELPAYKDTPIIATTAYSRSDMEKQVVEAGCIGMLAKPFTPSELVKTIEEFIKQS